MALVSLQLSALLERRFGRGGRFGGRLSGISRCTALIESRFESETEAFEELSIFLSCSLRLRSDASRWATSNGTSCPLDARADDLVDDLVDDLIDGACPEDLIEDAFSICCRGHSQPQPDVGNSWAPWADLAVMVVIALLLLAVTSSTRASWLGPEQLLHRPLARRSAVDAGRRHGPIRSAPPPQMQAGSVDIGQWLREEGGQRNGNTNSVIQALFGACRHVASKIATASCDSTSCFNDIGSMPGEEELLAIDLLAEEVLFSALEKTGAVSVASSESDKVLRNLAPIPPPTEDDHHASHSSHLLSVALDPLDASSIIDANFAVGTIFAVWESPSLLNVTGRELVAAGACTYGPRTAITLALSDRPGVHEFLLVGDRWLNSNVYARMSEGKLFAPGNLRAAATNPGYADLISHWQRAKYTLRYTGGLVPDVTQLLVKGSLPWPSPLSLISQPHLSPHTLAPPRYPSLLSPLIIPSTAPSKPSSAAPTLTLAQARASSRRPRVRMSARGFVFCMRRSRWPF